METTCDSRCAYTCTAHSDESWETRDPKYMRHSLSRSEFAKRYLSLVHPCQHLPHDCIALWQDARQNNLDAYILVQEDAGGAKAKKTIETVERVQCAERPAAGAVLLRFTWYEVGHYELITFHQVAVLPATHELDKLHEQYLLCMSKEQRRSMHWPKHWQPDELDRGRLSCSSVPHGKRYARRQQGIRCRLRNHRR